MELTINLSRLNISNPQNIANIKATITLLNTKNIAYPPEIIAINAVKKIVPPLPAYLAYSLGYNLNTSLLTPAHVHKNSFIFYSFNLLI